MNSLHLDFKVLFKQVDEPNFLSVVAGGNKKSGDGEIIKINQIVAWYDAVHRYIFFDRMPE